MRRCVLGVILAAGCSPTTAPAGRISIPGGKGGTGFDDLRYSPSLGRVLVPAGRTGDLDLIDPGSGAVTRIGGFSSASAFRGGHGEGTTSVDEGRGLLFAIDRTTRKLHVVDPVAHAIVASAALAGSPDYVRWVGSRNELWVTLPDTERIEVFSLPGGPRPTPVHSAFVAVPGGPESLVVDATRGRAYTHLWKGGSLAVDLARRRVVESWKNGCSGSRGIALDEPHGWLFVACDEGTVSVLDTGHGGAALSRLSTGDGVDVIAFNSTLAHLYIPAADSATMAIIGVSRAGQLSLLGSVRTAAGAHCVTADDHADAYVCDPANGRILRYTDPYPAN